MTLFTYANGNNGFYRPNSFRDYTLTALTLGSATLDLTNPGGYDETREAFRIIFTFAAATDRAVFSGPDSGGTTLLDGGRVFTGGTLSAITYQNQSGAMIATITDIAVPLEWLGFYFSQSSGLNSLYNYIFDGGARFVGSVNSDSGPQGFNGDELRTGIGNDVVVGQAGGEFILDRGGRDIYNGGPGSDTVSWDELFWNPQWGYQGVSATLSAARNRDFAVGFDGQRDTLRDIENLRGTFKDDRLIGDNGNNSFAGHQGRDVINGRGGYDTLRYDRDASFGANDGVVIDATSGVARDPSGDFDLFAAIERFRGTDQADTFISRGTTARFEGRGGDDVFIIDGGTVQMDGEAGNDAFELVGLAFAHEIDNFEFGPDVIRIHDFANQTPTVSDSGDGDALLTFTDGGANSATVELNGVSVAQANNQISTFGVSSFIEFPGGIAVPTLTDGGGAPSPGAFSPRVQWFDGNQGFFRYQNFNEANIDAIGPLSELGGAEGIRFLHDSATHGYDRTRQWHKAVFQIEGAEWHPYETGSATTRGGWFDNGTYAGGIITKITFYNDFGFKLLEVTNLKIDLAWFAGYYAREPDLWSLWDAAVGQNGTYLGSNYGGGPDTTWSGDDLKSGFGDDIVIALDGDDLIWDWGGKDRYVGGTGSDTLSYMVSFWRPDGLLDTGIVARLDKRYVDGPDGIRDTVIQIEGVEGTPLRDILVGDGQNNDLRGYGGADSINGLAGFDTVDYRNDQQYGGTSGINANMAAGWIVDGFGSVDRVANIERVVGTETDDTYRDSSGNDRFDARGGADTVTLSGGNDEVRLFNDGAVDTVNFLGMAFGNNLVRGFDSGQDKLDILSAPSYAALTITPDGNHTRIVWNGNTIIVEDTGGAILPASDFLF